MAFRLETSESSADGLKRIAREQVDKAIAELEDQRLPFAEAVHQVRKRCKRIRAAIRLFRPAFSRYAVENAFFRETASELSGLRDAAVMVDTFDSIMSAFREQIQMHQFARLRRRLILHRERVAERAQAPSDRLQRTRERMAEAQKRIAIWTLREAGFDAIEDGLRRTYARGRHALRTAYDRQSAATFHEWRKRVKYHLYHLTLLRGLWRPVFRSLRKEMSVLSDLLGSDHDLVIFRATLLSQPGELATERDLQVLLPLIDRHRAGLRAAARPLGRRVYAERPKCFSRRVRRYWEVRQLGFRSGR